MVVTAPVDASDMRHPSRSGRPKPALMATLIVVVAVFAVVQLDRTAASPVKVIGPVITPSAARQVLASVWAARELARTDDNVSALAAVDAGVELTRDMGVTLDAQGEDHWSQRVRRPFGSNSVFVPFQTTFPASFLAVVETTSQWSSSPTSHEPEGLATVLLVLTKASRSARWRVAMETSYHGTIWETDVGISLAGAGGPNLYAPPVHTTWITPSSAVSQLATFYDHYAQYGDEPPQSPFARSYWTTGQGKRIAEGGRNGHVNHLGYRNSVSYHTDTASDGIYQFSVADMELVCGTVRGTETATPAEPDGYLYQQPDRNNWGGWLAPGAYREITISLIHQVCLAISPEGVEGLGEGIRAISGDDEEAAWNVTGKPLFRYRPATPLGELA
jgi:hypothetical protein